MRGVAERRCRASTLGCWFRRGGRRRGRWEFAVGPDGAIREVFLFPDGDGALESVNGEAAGVKSGSAVWRADGDEYAGFTDLQAPQTVDDDDTVNGEFIVKLGTDLAEFGKGHRFIGFVIEIKRGAVVGLIADKTVEG